MRARLEACIAKVAEALAVRGVAPESTAIAGLVVSIAAGVALAAGGAAREPRLWLLVPSLATTRFVLCAIGSSLAQRRRA